MTRTRSIRTRLTLYFTAAFGITVVCLALGSYAVFRQQAYTDLDSALNVATGATAMSTAHELAEHDKQRDIEADLQNILDAASDSVLPSTQILIREGGRTVAHKGASEQAFNLADIPNEQIAASNGLPGLRVSARLIRVEKFHTAYQIFAASSIEPTLARLRKLFAILLAFVVFGLALSAVAGYMLAHQSLAPLKALGRTIESVTLSDLSARVDLHNASSEIAWLASGFNGLLDRLEKGFRSQRQFMADASHELRTPLTVALTAAQVTSRDKFRSVADADATLSLVEEQLLRLGRIVDSLLFLSQVDVSSIRLEFREFFIDDAITEASRAALAMARAKQQTLRISELPEALCSGDEDLCRQAVLILLDNSVKYTPVGGEIAISLTCDREFWRCRVWNNGPAIDR